MGDSVMKWLNRDPRPRKRRNPKSQWRPHAVPRRLMLARTATLTQELLKENFERVLRGNLKAARDRAYARSRRLPRSDGSQTLFRWRERDSKYRSRSKGTAVHR